MEKMGEWEQRSLVSELTQGREVARQLQAHLNGASSLSYDIETREVLVQKIEASYEKALSILNCNVNTSSASAVVPLTPVIRMPESPNSRCGSPPSEDSDRGFRDSDASKKRKAPRWTQQVRVTPGTALEGTLDDGFNWRKYGQKDILGSRFPRGYYRCTHRNINGCLATKQVQRSDDDPTIFDITYVGTHTCRNVTSHLMSEKNQEQGHSASSMAAVEPQSSSSSQDLLLNFQKGLKVKTQDLEDQTYASLIPYTSSTSNVVFSWPSVIDNNRNFVSPATSGTNFDFGTCDDQIIQASAAASVTSSPTVGLDHFHQLDGNFTFDNNGFFRHG
ncbi:hypothetical protein ERO13_A11G014000v2 [Gossypium hirsutum]|uniref:Probable WRKY transcription factor 53 n=1 Tax=Gossypium hirsutum TaxID=3635 RepID=A0A1U8L2P3_GOSHI|nr:probable WRKY transcription factor 53 [Gossypium hirsutum]KAG4172704.1 hypothetical protein ERO13_A11G014000v2 [Gossypium hirsutum]